VLFELEERLGMRILETLYEDNITATANKALAAAQDDITTDDIDTFENEDQAAARR